MGEFEAKIPPEVIDQSKEKEPKIQTTIEKLDGGDYFISSKISKDAFVSGGYYPKEKFANIDMMTLPKELQSKGLGKKMTKKFIASVKHFGGAETLGAHLTDIGALNVFSSIFGKENLGKPYSEIEKLIKDGSGYRILLKL